MKTLIAYFSWSGTTVEIAEKLARKTRGDLFRIERETPYSIDYHTCAYVEAREEADNDLRPAIKGPLPDLDRYDTVMIAFPIWWYTMPAPVKTFLESRSDWCRKKLFIFANSYLDIPSQFVNALRDAAACAKGADVQPGLYNGQIEKLCAWMKENTQALTCRF